MLYLREIGIGNAQIGLLLGISLAGGFVTSLAVMLFATRFTARTWAVVIATVTSIAGIVLIATDQYFPLLIGGFFGSYAASGVHWGPMLQVEQTGLSNLSQDRHRTRSFSLLNIASSIGRALGALLAGGATLLVAAYEFELVDAYRIMLAVYCVLNFVSAGGYLFLSSAPDGANSNQHQQATIQNPFKARARRNILTVSGLFAIDSFAGGMIFESFLSLWMVEKFGSSTAEVGLMLVAAQGLNIVSLTLAPTVAARIGLLNTLVFTQVGSNLALIAFAFAPSAWIAVALWMARSLLDEMDVPTRQSYMMGITEPDERPMMAGTANLGRGLGRVGSPSHHRRTMGRRNHSSTMGVSRNTEIGLRCRNLLRVPKRHTARRIRRAHPLTSGAANGNHIRKSGPNNDMSERNLRRIGISFAPRPPLRATASGTQPRAVPLDRISPSP